MTRAYSIFTGAKDELVALMRYCAKHIINERISQGVEDPITDWEEFPYYEIDLDPISTISVEVADYTFDTYFREDRKVEGILLDEADDIYLKLSAGEYGDEEDRDPYPVENLDIEDLVKLAGDLETYATEEYKVEL